jgi:uracil-DNA glycosylase
LNSLIYMRSKGPLRRVNNCINMDIFEMIKQEIMADPMNDYYTRDGISPLFKASENAGIAIVGQAPGRKAEKSQLYWNDLSGDRLREWMGISREEFYGTDRIAHLPMDFYYPGKAKQGDLPPRKGFAEKWHPLLLEKMPNIETIILVGNHAQKYYLGNKMEKNLTESVRNYKNYLPKYLPLVHPSPLNIGWFKRNPWFESEVLLVLKEIVGNCLNK